MLILLLVGVGPLGLLLAGLGDLRTSGDEDVLNDGMIGGDLLEVLEGDNEEERMRRGGRGAGREARKRGEKREEEGGDKIVRRKSTRPWGRG